jgi:hypothetical protein
VQFDDKVAYLPATAKERLQVEAGDKVSLVPFE